jgi:hypothetical protein
LKKITLLVDLLPSRVADEAFPNELRRFAEKRAGVVEINYGRAASEFELIARTGMPGQTTR